MDAETTSNAVAVPLRPWDAPAELLPLKPDFAPCGYVRDDTAEPCKPEELSAIFAAEPFQFLWLPEQARFLRAEDAPPLLENFRAFAVKAARGALTWGIILTLGSVALTAYLGELRFLTRNLFFILGLFMLGMGAWQYRRASRFTQDDARQMASEARFGAWLSTQSLPLYSFTNLLTVLFAAVLLVQFGYGGGNLGLDAAAVNKPLVRQGEWWRLLTGTVMHGGLLHFWFNTMALRDFGKLIETLARGAFVPLVFLFSAVCGSLLSLLLLPNGVSVGASGGLMGLLGFLLVASWRRPDAFPRWFFRSSLQNVGWIAFLGVAGFSFIDNAAHLGGLLGGAALGWLLIDPAHRDFPLQPSAAVVGASWAALLAIVATAVWAVRLIVSG